MSEFTYQCIIASIVVPVWLYIGYKGISNYRKTLKETNSSPFDFIGQIDKYYIRKDEEFKKVIKKNNRANIRLFLLWICTIIFAIIVATILKNVFGITK